jgi:hypothetical protein
MERSLTSQEEQKKDRITVALEQLTEKLDDLDRANLDKPARGRFR